MLDNICRRLVCVCCALFVLSCLIQLLPTDIHESLDKPAPKKMDFNEARDAVASAGPYANHLHFISDRQLH